MNTHAFLCPYESSSVLLVSNDVPAGRYRYQKTLVMVSKYHVLFFFKAK